MGQNKGFDRDFFVIGGSVKKTGGSLNLAKGQLAAIDQSSTNVEGAKVITSFAGKRKDLKDFVLKLGVTDNDPNRSYSNKGFSTLPFSLNEVKEIRVSAPERIEPIVDEFTIGFNGLDPDTSFKFQKGDSYFRWTLGLSGGGLVFRGGEGEVELASVNIEIPRCDPFETCVDCENCGPIDCRAIVQEAIERMKKTQITGGSLVEEWVDITPVFSCDTDVTATLIPYDYYTLAVCDTGGDEALALIQAQYDYKVIRLDRRGSTSVYQVFIKRDLGAPTDYSQGIASIIKGCDTCPAGYTATPEGYLYTFSIEDDGSDQSALFTALPNYVVNTIKRAPGHDAGIGQYTAVFSAELTDSQIQTFITGAAPRNTATVFKNGKVAALCADDSTTEFEWVLGDTCNAVEQTYTIILPDTECGEDRLEELQKAFPLNSVIIAQEDTGITSQTVTLTGTSGTANITVTGTGTPYLVTFATDLTTTANNFVTTHAADLLADEGITVTSPTAGKLTFVHATTAFPTITAPVNATGDLAGTIGAAAVVFDDVTGGCKTKYQATVVSNIVCDECDPIYKDYYATKTLDTYDLAKWTLVDDGTTTPSGNCLCGIRVKSKLFVLNPEMSLRNKVGFTETSTLIQASAGYTDEIREGIGRLPKGAFEAEYISRFTPRTHLAGNMLNMEAENRAYFTGYDNSKNYLGQVLRGETSNLEELQKQYVDYTIVIDSSKKSGGFGKTLHEGLEYHIFVGVGQHQDVEDLLNDLASNAGVGPVQAFGA